MQLGLKLTVHAGDCGADYGTFYDASMPTPLKVKTEQGKVHGKTINDGKVRAFLGLPYAAPPVGDLRWKAPAAAGPVEGRARCHQIWRHCMQGHVYDDMVFQDAGPSEDCLFLNVYAPADANGKSKLPVMFWIHGGGYSGGGARSRAITEIFCPPRAWCW